MKIRPALESDAELLSAVARTAKAHWGYARELLEAWDGELSVTAEQIRAKLTFVASVEDEIAGFYSLEPHGEAWKLDNLWVLPSFMNRRIGRALLAHALEVAARSGALEVTVDADPNAAPFYIACGAHRRCEIAAPIPGQPDRVRPQLSFKPLKNVVCP